MTYSELLKRPEWEEVRLRILFRDKYTCRGCGATSVLLNVHHTWYKSKIPWETPDSYLMTLCESCHVKEENMKCNDKDLAETILTSGMTRNEINQLIHSIWESAYNMQVDSQRYFILKLIDQAKITK